MDGILYYKIKSAWSLTGLEELGMSIQFLLILLGGSITSIYKKAARCFLEMCKLWMNYCQ